MVLTYLSFDFAAFILLLVRRREPVPGCRICAFEVHSYDADLRARICSGSGSFARLEMSNHHVCGCHNISVMNLIALPHTPSAEHAI